MAINAAVLAENRDLVATRAIIGATRGNVRFDKILAGTHSYSECRAEELDQLIPVQLSPLQSAE